MDTNVFLIILLATIMHAVWNGMVKKHPDKVVAVSGIVFGHVPASIIIKEALCLWTFIISNSD